jgi:TolC family type I secretion outer membrane protein
MLKLAKRVIRLSLISLALMGQYAGSQTLGVLVEQARKNDPQWLLANAKFRESLEYLPQAYSQILPSVSFSNTANQVTQQLTTGATLSPEQRYPSSSKVLSLRQPIFRTKQLFGIESARTQTEQALLVLREEHQQLILRVTDAYLNFLFATDRKLLLDSQKKLVDSRLKAALAGLRAGQGVRTDVDEAKAELSRILADEIQVVQAISLAKTQLEIIIGSQLSEFTSVNLQRFKAYSFTDVFFDDLLQQALSKSPKLNAQKLDIEIAKSLLSQAEAGHHPTLDLTAQVSQATGESSYFASTKNNSRIVGLQLNIPLYSGGLVNSQVRQSVARLEQTQEQFALTSNALRVQIQKESSAVQEGIKRIEAFELAVESAKQAVISNQKGVMAGTRSEFDVLKNLNQLTQVQVDLSKSRYELISSWIRLKAYVGELDDQLLEEMSLIFSK